MDTDNSETVVVETPFFENVAVETIVVEPLTVVDPAIPESFIENQIDPAISQTKIFVDYIRYYSIDGVGKLTKQ